MRGKHLRGFAIFAMDAANWKETMRLTSLILSLALLMMPGSPALAAGSKPGRTIQAKPAMWVVKDEDTTIYLFGTIHLLRPEIRWFQGPVRAAFDQSQQVVLEVAEEDKNASQGAIMRAGFAQDGSTISAKLDDKRREKFLAALKDSGADAALLDHMKPWFASLTLAVLPLRSLGYDPGMGADRIIEETGRAQGKTLTGLETSEQQIGFFSAMPEELQLRLLGETVDELPTLTSSIKQMIKAWSAGKPEQLAILLNESADSDPALRQRLLVDRNASWADWIKQRMDKPGTVFIAVGAGHLAGPDSVLDLLGKRGLTAVRVTKAP